MITIEVLKKLPDLTTEQAEHWIAALLAEYRALRQHDDVLFPRTNDPTEVERSHALHATWRRWADAAEDLLERLRPMLRGRRHVNGAADLDYAFGRTRAMLTITPESYLEGLEEGRRGEVVSHEEVRRELRDRMERRRAAGV